MSRSANLNQVLAGTITLRDMYKKHHWQIAGRTFYSAASSVRETREGAGGTGGRAWHVVRVHADVLKAQKLPSSLVTRRIWDERFDDINAFERHLARNGTVVRSAAKRRDLARARRELLRGK
jgi:hypothetical protein